MNPVTLLTVGSASGATFVHYGTSPLVVVIASIAAAIIGNGLEGIITTPPIDYTTAPHSPQYDPTPRRELIAPTAVEILPPRHNP